MSGAAPLGSGATRIAGIPTVADFGDGSDGNVIVDNPIVLAADMQYNNLSIQGTGSIHMGPYYIRVRNTLFLNSSVRNIENDGLLSGDNSAGVGFQAGAAGGAFGATGGGGGNTGGSNGSQSPDSMLVAGGASNTSGDGNVTVSGQTPGHGLAGTLKSLSIPEVYSAPGHLILAGAHGGAGGSGGGGSQEALSGRWGGGGGGGGGPILIYARTINTTGNAGTVSANGGDAGNGGHDLAGEPSGGGGSGGGAGWIYIVCLFYKRGPKITLRANGGYGGRGYTGPFGDGTNGCGGDGGTIVFIQMNYDSNLEPGHHNVTVVHGTAGSLTQDSPDQGGRGGACTLLI